MTDVQTVYTIGHGDADFDTIASRLDQLHVQTIVDVRSAPYSKHAPDFRKSVLAEFCAEAGFGYRWLGDRLGGLEDPSPDAFGGGITEVLGLAATSRIALLCGDVDPARCHRARVIAPALIERGCRVVHILGDGVAPHQPDLGLRTD